MLKVLRKYNKIILVLGGILLMIAFLVPQALTQMGSNPGREVVATLDGRSITGDTLGMAVRESEALDIFSPVLTRIVLRLGDRPDHWFLLTREAERAGFIGEDLDGSDWIPELASGITELQVRQEFPQAASQILSNPQFREMFTNQTTERLAQSRLAAQGRAQLTDEQFDRALAKARGVFRMINAYERAARFSDRQAVVAAKDTLDSAVVDYVFIPASAMTAEVPEPDQAELQAHFERFRDVAPGSGEFGIGYRLPPRVKLEWLTIDRAILDAIVAADPVEVRKHWTRNRETYPGEFAAERARVETDLKNQTISTILQEAALAVQTEVAKATRRLEPDGEFKKLPEDWESNRPTLEAVSQAIVDQVKARTGIDIPLPQVTVRTSEWLTGDELAALPGIGSATMRVGGNAVPFAEAALQMRELNTGSRLRLQTGLPVVEFPVTDAAGSRYYFTVLATRPESPPDSLDEIRDRVVEDYKRLQAYEQLAKVGEGYVDIAVNGGLQAVADAINAKQAPPEGSEPADAPEQIQVRTTVNATRDTLAAPDADVNTPEIRTAIMEAAEGIDPLQPAVAQDASIRTFAEPIPGALGLAVVQVTGRRPLTNETFRSLAQSTIARAQQTEFQEAFTQGSSPFSYERLVERHDYELISKQDQGEERPADDAVPASTIPGN